MNLKYLFLYISVLFFLMGEFSFSQTFFEKDSLNVFEKYNSNHYLVCGTKMDVPELSRRIGLKKVSYKATLKLLIISLKTLK